MSHVGLSSLTLLFFVGAIWTDSDLSGKEQEERIVGGQQTTIDKFPYQLAMITKEGTLVSMWCGAAIVSEYWAFTAAHCTAYPVDENFKSGQLHLRGNVTEWIDRKTSCTHKVVKMIVHPQFSGKSLDYDMCVMKVQTPFNCEYEKPVKVASKNYVYQEDTTVVISGWGITGPGSPNTEYILREVKIKLYNHDKCADTYQTKAKIALTERQICAWDLGKDACSGDSGGPMVQDGVLIALVSAGIACNSSIFPGLYVKIPEYYDWIRTVEKDGGFSMQVNFVGNQKFDMRSNSGEI